VRSGLAYVYAKYLNNCPPADEVKQAESVAKQQRLGVWRRNFTPPWEFRNRQRSLK
jgi:micrococcal nuclease